MIKEGGKNKKYRQKMNIALFMLQGQTYIPIPIFVCLIQINNNYFAKHT